MTSPADPKPILSRIVSIADIPGDGTTVRIVATEAERTALAADLDLPAIHRLEAEVTVKPWSRTGFIMEGRVSADITQTCVVSLEPIEAKVDEAIEVKFAPEAEEESWLKRLAAAAEADPEATGEDPPDFFAGGTLDPGAVAEQQFVLGIDPYPRKPGAAFDAAAYGVAEPDEAKPSPFAALAKLKKD
ncbi:YceD family protein [Prosthecodimorpha staleyi]|uniref:DUF177 domain-containing protein n=1 Tax=Prosthecodimorpha staleyi TaxID=2840188 RepID=A0A947D892_9HYPH|nr:DUF177 domain-containing protein [Prosthecodimorpha staleyi]MBT9290022.1 DUF177 domain-containing protein [Prosthecodimorpha staleyi]